jgi:hypothetical protein
MLSYSWPPPTTAVSYLVHNIFNIYVVTLLMSEIIYYIFSYLNCILGLYLLYMWVLYKCGDYILVPVLYTYISCRPRMWMLYLLLEFVRGFLRLMHRTLLEKHHHFNNNIHYVVWLNICWSLNLLYKQFTMMLFIYMSFLLMWEGTTLVDWTLVLMSYLLWELMLGLWNYSVDVGSTVVAIYISCWNYSLDIKSAVGVNRGLFTTAVGTIVWCCICCGD